MRHAPSLEDERRALLAQIDSSRDMYRRMLNPDAAAAHHAPDSRTDLLAHDSFPRSTTVRWILDHPYLSALAVASLVVIVSSRRRIRPAALRAPMVRSLAGMAAMLLRDPTKLRMATNIFSAAAAFLRQRRPGRR
ncbi:MAG: hypothetical protein V4632_14025 [Pseudomonadota bacterium]